MKKNIHFAQLFQISNVEKTLQITLMWYKMSILQSNLSLHKPEKTRFVNRTCNVEKTLRFYSLQSYLTSAPIKKTEIETFLERSNQN